MGSKPARPKPGQQSPLEDARKHPPSVEQAKVRVSFERYVHGGTYCLSKWNETQICSFLDCLRKLTERTWQQVISGSSKGAGKTGLNSTMYPRTALKNPDIWPDWLDGDTKVVGIRASERSRIFGVRNENEFHVLWFDEQHGIVKG